MNCSLMILSLVLNFLLRFSQAEVTDVVNTKYGPVCGDILETVDKKTQYLAFKGIPYAEPPTGKNRFQPPKPPKPWEEVFHAKDDTSACPQIDTSKNFVGEEDCLYLNVYSPELKSNSSTLRTVMVWIHGGAFQLGSKASAFFGPDFLIDQDVVVVAMNYRLGALGFLALDNDEISSNNGLKDQVLALKWVNENIEEFGGDPDKITIFGESAGSVSVELHHLSEMSKGLFRASIAMSGSPLNEWGFHDRQIALNYSINAIRSKLIESFDPSSADDIAELRELPFENFARLDRTDKSSPSMSFLFLPTTEISESENQPFITDEPINIYESGDFTHVPHILGYMNEEVIGLIGTLFPTSFEKNRTLIDIVTLSKFRKGINQTRELMEKSSTYPVFYYRNVYDYPQALHKVRGVSIDGSGHGDDLAYVFYVSNKNQPLDPEDETVQFRNKIVAMWTNFAKNLNPTEGVDNIDIDWPQTDDKGLLLEMGTEFKVLPCDE